ncbi:MAG: hypothetical protein KatS3mg087_0548 [Patescibacteria group bacterium]|nr:MAG: hypothetical protein KatS3mg087_0548 [Patescibacteria group bacterium]
MSRKAKAFAGGFHPWAKATGFSTYALINMLTEDEISALFLRVCRFVWFSRKFLKIDTPCAFLTKKAIACGIARSLFVAISQNCQNKDTNNFIETPSTPWNVKYKVVHIDILEIMNNKYTIAIISFFAGVCIVLIRNFKELEKILSSLDYVGVGLTLVGLAIGVYGAIQQSNNNAEEEDRYLDERVNREVDQYGIILDKKIESYRELFLGRVDDVKREIGRIDGDIRDLKVMWQVHQHSLAPLSAKLEAINGEIGSIKESLKDLSVIVKRIGTDR